MTPRAGAVAVSAFLALAATAALAQEALTVEDFVRRAAEDNRADAEIGGMVRNDPALPQGVHRVGGAVADTASRLDGPLAALAQSHQVRLGSELGEQDRQMIQQLSRIQGEEFTRDYLQFVINDLERDIKLYQDAAGIGSAAVGTFVEETLPALRANLALARRVWDEQTAQAPEGQGPPPE